MKLAAILLFAALTATAADLRGPLVAHEWGTFTSVAGENGQPLSWAPLYGAADLPCFVAHLGDANFSKWQFAGLVRMETPVLYFYAARPTTVSVHVDFPEGLITEWYPEASKVAPNASSPAVSVYRNGSIEWDAVRLVPGANPEFPVTRGASRYYAARHTGATPLRAGNQQEKLIFYRGVGSFQPALRPGYDPDGKLVIRNAGAETVPLAIVFESHAGKIGFRTVRNIRDTVTPEPPAMTGDLEHLRAGLAASLVEAGLYQDEALAMLETWSDSWFEEGSRVFYILPEGQVNAILPLRVTPAPAETRRVFVGRVEILSPATRQTIMAAAAKGDAPALRKFGRFLSVFAQQLQLPGTTIQRALGAMAQPGAPACIQ